VVERLWNRWNSAFLIDAARSSIVCAQGKRKIIVVLPQQQLQQLSSGLDILFRIEGVLNLELFRSGRHQLHEAFGSAERDCTWTCSRLFLDHRFDELK